jgi:DNA invertase Pin-like site-specific DNA recombinase
MLKERGIALVSLEEKIDTASAAGELILWRSRISSGG